MITKSKKFGQWALITVQAMMVGHIAIAGSVIGVILGLGITAITIIFIAMGDRYNDGSQLVTSQTDR